MYGPYMGLNDNKFWQILRSPIFRAILSKYTVMEGKPAHFVMLGMV